MPTTSQPKSKMLLSAWGMQTEAPVRIPPTTGRIPKVKKGPIMANKYQTQNPMAKDSLSSTPSLASASTSAGHTPSLPPPMLAPSEAPVETQGFVTPPNTYRGQMSPISIPPAQTRLELAKKDIEVVEVASSEKTPTAKSAEDEAKALFRQLAKTDAEDPSQAKLRGGGGGGGFEQPLEPYLPTKAALEQDKSG